MQVKSTHIVKSGSGTFIVMYVTFDGKYFISTHIVGQVKEITNQEAHKLM